MQTPPIWQRLLAALAYLLPWSDAFPFGRGLFGLFPALETAVKKDQRKPALVTRARADLADWMKVA